MTDKTLLKDISDKCRQFKTSIDNYLNKYKIDIKDLQLILESKRTYLFIIKHQGENFNDLYERLDTDNYNIKSSVIACLNYGGVVQSQKI